MSYRVFPAMLLALVFLLSHIPALEAAVPATPNELDIPKPEPMFTSLAGAAQPDIVRFLNVGSATAPSLSPDGQQLAFRSSLSGQPQLWVTGTGSAWPSQLTFGESVTFHQWSPAGDWIIYGTDRGGDEQEGFYLITPDGQLERELLAPADTYRVFGGFTRDGRQIAYAEYNSVSDGFDIYLLEIESGESKRVLVGRPGLYVGAWKPGATAVLLTESRGEDAVAVSLFNLTTQRVQNLFDPEERSHYGSFSWLPDGSGFYLTTNEGREYSNLAFYDLKAQKLSYLTNEQADVAEVALNAEGTLLAWTINAHIHHILEMAEVRTKKPLDITDRVKPVQVPEGVYSLSWAPRSDHLAIEVRSSKIAGDIWRWDVAGKQLTRLTYSSTAGLDMNDMVQPTHHSFPARDGVILHGLLYLPKNTSSRKPPVVIRVHGGPTAEASPIYRAEYQYLLRKGIAIFDLNYRGSTGYGKRFARLNDGLLRANEYFDIADAQDWLSERGDVDADRAGIAGWSYGGYLTMAALTRLPDRFRAGMAGVGVSNWITALEGASPSLRASDRYEYGDIDNVADRAFFEAMSPLYHVQNIVSPIMVVHGANDTRDPVEESDQFVRAIREMHGKVEYLRFPDEGHHIRKYKNKVILYRRAAAFWEKHLLN